MRLILFVFFCFGFCNLFAQIPEVKIVSVKVGNSQEKNNKPKELDLLHKGVTMLPYNQNSLYFEFANLQQTANKSFYYKLDGLEYNWIMCNNCSSIQYAHLDGGKYTFLVKTNQPNATEAKFEFEIEGNILHKWWLIPSLFLYAMLLLGVAAYFFVVVNFRRKLKDQETFFNEKMKSMGELSSGISHELQNPLNFVNNFAELSIELINELKLELEKLTLDNSSKEYFEELFFDIENNLDKIASHGKRASNIVINMRNLSNFNLSIKEPTNINESIIQNINSFIAKQNKEAQVINVNQAKIVFQLSDHLPQIPILKGEFEKALNHLISNALYAVKEQEDPIISVSTEKIGKSLVLKINDNGIGISPSVKAKIFQPFFTTKPTNLGTGLGLSLTYDIVTKGHGGTIEVESVEGEGTEFIVKFPV